MTFQKKRRRLPKKLEKWAKVLEETWNEGYAKGAQEQLIFDHNYLEDQRIKTWNEAVEEAAKIAFISCEHTQSKRICVCAREIRRLRKTEKEKE